MCVCVFHTCGRLLVSLAPLQRWPIALSAPAEALMKMAKWRLVTPSLQSSPKLSPAIMFPSKGSVFVFFCFFRKTHITLLCACGGSVHVWIRWLHPSGLAADIFSRVFQRDWDREEKKKTHTHHHGRHQWALSKPQVLLFSPSSELLAH